MKTIGLPISHKENEFRRTLVPEHIRGLEYTRNIYLEKGYGNVLGISDEEYSRLGCVVCDRSEVLKRDIICDPKIGDAEYLTDLSEGQVLFGWIHATQNRTITDKIIDHKLTAIAWEKMYDCGRHVFWRNNELAGEAAVMHACVSFGRMPYGMKAAVIGRGNTARGAVRVLERLGASVVQYNRKAEALLRKELGSYDVVVNCVLWDVGRTDHIIYKSDLKKMKMGALIIDVSCDAHGGIETSVPTTISNPTYYVDGICHYVVDHTPSLFYKTFSWENSEVVLPFIKQLIEENHSNVLSDAIIIKKGIILDDEIIRIQHR